MRLTSLKLDSQLSLLPFAAAAIAAPHFLSSLSTCLTTLSSYALLLLPIYRHNGATFSSFQLHMLHLSMVSATTIDKW